MNATERKKRSRIAERLGLVAAPRGYVTLADAITMKYWIELSAKEIDAEMKEPKK